MVNETNYDQQECYIRLSNLHNHIITLLVLNNLTVKDYQCACRSSVSMVRTMKIILFLYFSSKYELI